MERGCGSRNQTPGQEVAQSGEPLGRGGGGGRAPNPCQLPLPLAGPLGLDVHYGAALGLVAGCRTLRPRDPGKEGTARFALM